MRTDTSFKQNINMVEVAQQNAQLRKVSGKEWAGPCPKCGGDDRFHVTPEWFFCRQCHPERGDAIELTQWLHGVDFRQACDMLTNGNLPSTPIARTLSEKKKMNSKPELDWRSEEWQDKAGNECGIAHEELINSSFRNDGQDYLLDRGIGPDSWGAFRLGFNSSAYVPGGDETAPAILIPWIIGGTLRGIRYRFINNGGPKSSSYKGSRFVSTMFGGHAMEDGIPEKRTLVICEGELNAISIWQVANGTNLDVLSMGSESAKLSTPMVNHAKRYASVIVWADEERVTKSIMSFVPRSHGITSPGGKDANDMLQDGNLGRYLSVVRHKGCETDNEREELLWSLWDRSQTIQGLDDGSEEVMSQIADSLGREI